MLSNREKAVLIIEISAHNQESTCKSIVSLLDILLQETREANDTSSGEEYFLNQGEIRAYKRLRDMIMRGLPGGK